MQVSPFLRHQPVVKHRMRQEHLTAFEAWTSVCPLCGAVVLPVITHNDVSNCYHSTFPSQCFHTNSFLVPRTSPGPPASSCGTALLPLGIRPEVYRTRPANIHDLKQRVLKFIQIPWGNTKTCYDLLSIATAGVYWTTCWSPRCHIQTIIINRDTNVSISVNTTFPLYLKMLFHFNPRQIKDWGIKPAVTIASADFFLPNIHRIRQRQRCFIWRHSQVPRLQCRWTKYEYVALVGWYWQKTWENWRNRTKTRPSATLSVPQIHRNRAAVLRGRRALAMRDLRLPPRCKWIFALLGCYAVLIGSCLPTFRSTLSVPLSRSSSPIRFWT